MNNIDEAINEIVDYEKELKAENQYQKEILKIFKEQLHISVYIAYFNGKPMHLLKMFEADIFITKEIYDKLKEWLDNGK